jgi:hypothetical protein
VRYPSGQPVRVSTTIKDVTGALVNAGALTLLVKLAAADGTWTTTGTYASPANDSTGTYHQDIPVTDLAVIGHYQYTWTATGTGAGVAYGDFDVYDPFEQAGAQVDAGTMYCTAEELKQRLRLASGADDEQADVAVAAASRAIDGYCERYFYKAAGTRTYVPDDLYRCRTDDLVSVSALATDPGGTTPQGGTFPVTWAARDFQLLPYNPGKTGEQWPFTSIRAVGALTFPWVIPLILMRMDRVQVTGVFGWPLVPQSVRLAALITASELFRMKDMTAGGVPGEFTLPSLPSWPQIGQLIGVYRRNPVLAA